MPVRIYDIAKKLGIESKDVLLIAKDLRIAAAKVPSSSLDKISAEWLEEEIIKSRPDIAARLNSPHVAEPPKPAPVEEKILIISAPPAPKSGSATISPTGCASTDKINIDKASVNTSHCAVNFPALSRANEPPSNTNSS